jgi:hypothetical protein
MTKDVRWIQRLSNYFKMEDIVRAVRDHYFSEFVLLEKQLNQLKDAQ